MSRNKEKLIGVRRQDGLIVPIDLEASKSRYVAGKANLVDISELSEESDKPKSRGQNAFYWVMLTKTCEMLAEGTRRYSIDKLNYDICFACSVIHEEFQNYIYAKEYNGVIREIFSPKRISQLNAKEFKVLVEFAKQYILETHSIDVELFL